MSSYILAHTYRVDDYFAVCLICARACREKRLREARGQSELITQEMENFAQVLQAQTLALHGVIIDSSHQSVAEIVAKISKLIATKL